MVCFLSQGHCSLSSSIICFKRKKAFAARSSVIILCLINGIAQKSCKQERQCQDTNKIKQDKLQYRFGPALPVKILHCPQGIVYPIQQQGSLYIIQPVCFPVHFHFL